MWLSFVRFQTDIIFQILLDLEGFIFSQQGEPKGLFFRLNCSWGERKGQRLSADRSAWKKAGEDRPILIKDYDVGLYVKWKNIEVGKVYGPHILHQSLPKLYGPLFARIRVIDFCYNMIQKGW